MLKSFLKGGEAEEHEGVTIEWIRGKRAELIIYDGEEEKERIDFFALKTKEEMHNMLDEKGFKRKNQNTINEEFRIQSDGGTQIVKEGQLKPMLSIYSIVGLVTILFAIMVQTRRKKTRRTLLPMKD